MSGAKLNIDLDKNSPDTVRLFDLCRGVRVEVELSERRGGACYDITFSPHTDSINMSRVDLYPEGVTRLHQLVSLFQSWTVSGWLHLSGLGPEDWTELSRSLDTLDDSVREVRIQWWSAPPSVSLLKTIWNKTEEELQIDGDFYYKTNEEDFSRLVMKHFQLTVEHCDDE